MSSAHWYWDWNWGDRGGHKRGDEVPEKMRRERGPCKKTATYETTQDGSGNNIPTDAYNNASEENQFILMEVNCDGHHLVDPNDPYPPQPEYYVIKCEKPDPQCCKKGGCNIYKTRVEIPNKTIGGQQVFLTDFKCRCISP